MQVNLFMRLTGIAILILPGAPQLQSAQPAKLVAFGWDRPSVETLIREYAKFEEQPFAGVAFEVAAGSGVHRQSFVRAFTAAPWNRSWFATAAEQLRVTPFGTLTDNFVHVGANPGDVDWFDDEGWKQIADHWRIAAWFARHSRSKGIVFDPEPYTEPYQQFNYLTQLGANKYSFAEYQSKARERGRQVMEAVVAEYPDIRILCLFLNSVNCAAANSADPSTALAGQPYGLYPAFLDGWLDAATPEMRIIDGCEAAYDYNSEAEYLDAVAAIRGTGERLVSQENRSCYRQQVQVAFGFYLDAYSNPPDDSHYIDPKGTSAVARLQANLATAAHLTDEYLWIHGEEHRWFPRPDRPGQRLWDDAMPGSRNALRLAGWQEGATATWEANLAKNGSFDASAGGGIDEWGAWQSKDSRAVFTVDQNVEATHGGAARISGAAKACLTQTYDVSAGEVFRIGAKCRTMGRGAAAVRVRWKTAAGVWTSDVRDVLIADTIQSGVWLELSGQVRVPDSAGRMQVQLSAAGQAGPEDSAWFDEVIVTRLSPIP